MKDRKKLLYIMGIDWDWIFQRPQIMEQHLESRYDVTVVFPRSILKTSRKSERCYPEKYKILWTLPFQEKNRVIGWLSSLYSRRLFKNLDQYDLIVVGYPLYFRYIPVNYVGRVIYDCMDNHEALYPDRKNVDKIVKWENKLIERSDLVIATAGKLLEKIQALAPSKKRILIRNGTKNGVISKPMEPRMQEKYQIGYFGTIAEWFDFELLKKSLEVCSDIEYHLIGPMAMQCEQKNPGIVFKGIVQHEDLYEATKNYSCFIMPFVVNDIVEWVDPVKLYEYISMGKCIISVRYTEIERFEEFVYMYSNTTEFLDILQKLKKEGFPPKYTDKQQKDFLEENSWETRFEVLDKALSETIK